MGPSEELTADMLVSLFPPAILLESASVISHATDKQLRPLSIHTFSWLCVIADEEEHQDALLQTQIDSLGMEWYTNT